MGQRPVVVVDSVPVPVEEFAVEWNIVRGAQSGIAPMGEAAARKLKQDLLDRIVERALVLAAAKGKVVVTPEEVGREIAEMRMGYGEEQFNETMVGGFMTQETLAARVRERLTVQRFYEDVVFRGLQAEGEAEAYLKSHPEEFGRPEQVRVLHIVTRTEDEMNQVRERLGAGEDFGAVARRYSAGPEAASGGALPLYGRGRMPRVFDVAFMLDEGAVSAVQTSGYGFHVLKLVRKYPAAQMSHEEALEVARLKMLESKKREARQKWLATARAAASVRVDQKLIDSIP
jgi:parvulin-like peptidyl-prolyl isomerase